MPIASATTQIWDHTMLCYLNSTQEALSKKTEEHAKVVMEVINLNVALEQKAIINHKSCA